MNYFASKGITPGPFMERHMLSVGPRPAKQFMQQMGAWGITDAATLLHEDEGGQHFGPRFAARGVRWHWLPLQGADINKIDPVWFKAQLTNLAGIFRASPTPLRIHVHCSAGIHRTGMVAYGLLRLSGLDPDQAAAALTAIRPITGGEVTQKRLRFVDRLLE